MKSELYDSKNLLNQNPSSRYTYIIIIKPVVHILRLNQIHL